MDQIAADYNAQSPGPTSNLNSWDAVGSLPIITKSGCAASTRPGGGSAGTAVLAANTHPSTDTTDYCIDFAGTTRNPSPGTGFTYVGFGQDAVTWSATTTAFAPTHAPTALSILELRAIYDCSASLIPHSPAYPATPVTWNEVGGSTSNTVVPVLPQLGSDTRSLFLNVIGVSTPGTCVHNNGVNANEGTNQVFAGPTSADLIFPYSIGVFLAQTEHGHGTGSRGNQILGNVLNSTGTPIAPTTGTPPNAVINGALATLNLLHPIYNVVRDSGTATHIPPYLQNLFGASNNTGYLCASPTTQADILNYGFRTIGTNCGTPSTSGLAPNSHLPKK